MENGGGCFPQKMYWQNEPNLCNSLRAIIMKSNKCWGIIILFITLLASTAGYAAGEGDINVPPLDAVRFEGLGGVSGTTLMYLGLVICLIGAVFGLVQYKQTKRLPVHQSM